MTEPMDTAAKLRVREALLVQARAAVAGLDTEVAEEHAASERTGSGSTSVDDLSQADEAGDLGGLFEESGAHARATLQQIEGLDFGVTDTVRPGAIVGFDGDRYIVGVLTSEVECDGTTYEGITSDAPIYAVLAGLRVGETFEFAGHTHQIDLVI